MTEQVLSELRSVDISLVIPAFNESENLPQLLDECCEALDQYRGDHEILLIDDGSTDATSELLERSRKTIPMLRIVSHLPGENIGCHPSELEGFAKAKGKLMLFLPADLQIRPDVLHAFVNAADGADIVASHRVNRADAKWRQYIARVNNLIERLVIGVKVHDAHSSMLISRRARDLLVSEINSRSALIPAELLMRAAHQGLPIGEIEIEHYPRRAGQQTGVSVIEVLKVQWDMIRLRLSLGSARSRRVSAK